MPDDIRACPGLDRLVAEKALGWSPESIADRYLIDNHGEKASTVPRWSSDPGEALNLLHQVNLERAAQNRLPLNLYSCLTTKGLGYICGTLIFGAIPESAIVHDPTLAISIGVLKAHGVPEDKIRKACHE